MVLKSAKVRLVLLRVRFSLEKVGNARVPYCEKLSPSSRNSCPVATVGFILWPIETVESEEWNKRIVTVTSFRPGVQNWGGAVRRSFLLGAFYGSNYEGKSYSHFGNRIFEPTYLQP
jgi:hypothetical protein